MSLFRSVGLILITILFSVFCYAQQNVSQIRSFVHPFHGDQGYCSLVVIEPNLALTAEHCIAQKGLVTYDGHPITTVQYDVDKDLALVTGQMDCPCARIASHNPIRDQTVYVVGYPLGKMTENTQVVTYGEVQGDLHGRLLHTANTMFGSSGGGLFHYSLIDGWELVGITSQLLGSPIPGTPFGFPVSYLSLAVGVDLIHQFLAAKVNH